MEAAAIAEYLAFGFVGGVIGGLLGVGGSIGFIPLATIFLAPDKQQLQGAAMIANFVVALTAYRRYRRAGSVDWTLARRLVPPALVAVLAGVAASLFVDAPAFRLLFGLFLFAVAAREIVHLARGRADGTEHGRDLRGPVATAIGAVMGFLSGLLGIGGGTLMMPLLRGLGRLPLRQAVGTSSAVTIVAATVAATAKNASLAGLERADGSPLTLPATLGLAALLVPTAVAGGFLGTALVYRLKVTSVRWIFLILIGLSGIRMIDLGLH